MQGLPSSHLIITLWAGRLTPAARVLVVHNTDIAPDRDEEEEEER